MNTKIINEHYKATDAPIFENEEFVLYHMQPRFVDETVETWTNIWTTQNIPTMALGITPAEYRPLARYYCEKYALPEFQHFSTIIVSKKNKEIAGYFINADAHADPTLLPTVLHGKLTPKLDIHSKFLATIEKPIFENYKHMVRPGKSIRGVGFGIKPQYLRGGIAKLAFSSLFNIATYVFDVAMDTSTHPGTFAMSEGLGFVEVNRLIWKDFKYENTFPFAKITNPDHARCYMIEFGKLRQKKAMEAIIPPTAFANTASAAASARL